MSFTDQKPFTVTEEHLKTRWCGYRDARMFRCAWCGHRFELGDTARWVYTNGSGEETKGIAGNPFICARCDGPRPEILARLRAALSDFKADRLWWFRRHSSEVNDAVNDAIRDEQRAERASYDEGYERGLDDAKERW